MGSRQGGHVHDSRVFSHQDIVVGERIHESWVHVLGLKAYKTLDMTTSISSSSDCCVHENAWPRPQQSEEEMEVVVMGAQAP